MKTKVSDIISGIIAQKDAKGLTNQQIADAAGVSKTTVDRVLRNDPAITPNAQTLFDIANAVGYSVVEASRPDAGSCEAYIRQFEAHHREMVAAYNRSLAVKSFWLRITVIICLVLVFLIIAVLLFDLLRYDVGWIREQ